MTALIGLGGCSNPFLASYKGVRCPTVSTAHVSVRAPTDATLIGRSDFVTDVALGNPEAIAAAEEVGADIVQWERAFRRQDVALLRQSLAGDGLAPETIIDLPVDAETNWYRFHARFWRSNALGGFPPAAPAPSAAPAPLPEPAPPPEIAPLPESTPLTEPTPAAAPESDPSVAPGDAPAGEP